MRRALAVALVALALAGGCRSGRALHLDASLPDGEARELSSAREALEEATESVDPTLRGPALAWLVRGLPVDALPRWVAQGTYDPDPWVQRHVALALLERLGEPLVRDALVEYALRGSGDPYVRAHVAHALIDEGHASLLGGLRTAWSGRAATRAGPLALVAVRLGEDAARPVVERALAEGAMRDDPDTIAALGRFGWPALADAALAAQRWVEDETRVRFDLARALLGDAGGRGAWRAALRGSVDEQRDALDVVLALPPADATRWLREARGARDAATRLVAAAAASPSPRTVGRALASDDPYARSAAARLAARLPAADATPLLLRALVDDDADVRVTAAGAAATLRARALLPAVEALAVDDRLAVRVAGHGARLVLQGSDVGAGRVPPAPPR